MLITQLKDKEEIASLVTEKTFLIYCHGCKEIYFPEEEVNRFRRELAQSPYAGNVIGELTTDYICNPEYLRLLLDANQTEIEAADRVLVFSCGVGVQTVADFLRSKKVYGACDTIALPGFQGVTPLEYDCDQCGECFLNQTGGICPITACSKSLVNGPCGGTKNGMCEVDPTMECGWDRILRRLKEQGRSQALSSGPVLHDFSTASVTKIRKEANEEGRNP